MTKQYKIVSYKRCLSCNYKCEQKANDLKICLRQEQIKSLDNIFNEQFKDNIKFHILWFLDDKNCSLALTKAKELSQTVDKIIEEIKISIDK